MTLHYLWTIDLATGRWEVIWLPFFMDHSIRWTKTIITA